ncbi:MAG: hypothetical protein LC798_06070, partial [Chloroflexi bacterium]|nr:hypothetical protein [Chloroflexota bacterium]
GLRKGAQLVGGGHSPMIGVPPAASAGVAVLGLALLFGPMSADPSVGAAAERLIGEREAAAIAALDDLRDAVEPGLEAARIAAAGVLSGEEPPSRGLEEAAGRIAGAEEAGAAARRAVRGLAAARGAWRPEAPRPPAPVAVGELSSIAAQLRETGDEADAFADLRLRGTGLPGALEEVLGALDRGDLDEATELTARARADHDAIVARETDLATLPVWVDTTDAMITAVEQIIDATRRGDDAAATRAGDSFVALTDDAATADRALRIALAEGGSALTAAPLERLAAVLGGIDAARAGVAAILSGQSP